MQEWHYLSDTQERTPLRANDLPSMVASGMLRSQTMVWKEGMEDWVSCGEVMPELFEAGTGRPDSAGGLASLARGAAPLATAAGWVRSCGLAGFFLAILIFTACAELIIRQPGFFTSGGMIAVILKNTAVVLALLLGGAGVWLGLVSTKAAGALPALAALDESSWAHFSNLGAKFFRVAAIFVIALATVALFGTAIYLFL